MKNILSILTAALVLSAPMSTAVSAEQTNDCMASEIFEQILSENFENSDNSENTTPSALFDRLTSLSCESIDCNDLLKILWDKLSDCDSPAEMPDETPNLPEEPSLPDIPNESLPDTPDLDDDYDHDYGYGNDDRNDKDDTDNDSEKPLPDDTVSDDTVSSDTSALAAEILLLVNAYRAQNGIAAVQYDATVQKAARLRAEELRQSFSHTRPNGSRCFTALDEVGADYHGAGENIAMGQTTAREVMTDWMNSEGHRANILNENFTTLGVGISTDANGKTYWAQMFVY